MCVWAIWSEARKEEDLYTYSGGHVNAMDKNHQIESHYYVCVHQLLLLFQLWGANA